MLGTGEHRPDGYAPRMTPAWESTLTTSAALRAAEHVDTGAPPIVWGVAAFVLLLAMLAITLAFGRGRG